MLQTPRLNQGRPKTVTTQAKRRNIHGISAGQIPVTPLDARRDLWETEWSREYCWIEFTVGELLVDDANTKDDWVARLTGPEPEREQAIVELRDLLVRGLQKSLSTKYGTGLQADDVVQDALMKILASLDQFEGRSRFTTWAMTIATRVGISELRRKHFKDVSLDSMKTGDSLMPASPAVEESPGNQLDRQKLLGTLTTMIESRLTDKQRGALEGLLDGLPVEEIARRSGSNRNAVYKLVHDARMRLRDGFTENGITVHDVNAIYS